MTDKNARAKEIEEAVRRHDSEKEGEGDMLDKVLGGIDSIGTRLGALEGRMDALEAGKSPLNSCDDDDDGEGEGENEIVEKGKAKRTVADSVSRAIGKLWREQALTEAQGRADGVAQCRGEQAPRPLDGETPLNYRKRLLRPHMKHSTEFKEVDLGAIDDPILLGGIEQKVYADSIAASAKPERYYDKPGLTEVVKVDASGRRIIEFVGKHHFVHLHETEIEAGAASRHRRGRAKIRLGRGSCAAADLACCAGKEALGRLQ